LLSQNYHLFTLSRGFGRRVYGFQIADEKSTAITIGDEPLQYYKKYGNKIGVAVDSKRVFGVMDICKTHPLTNLIILDDAFQHRAIQAGLSILLTAYDDPFYKDFILPVGNLREFSSGKKRADIIVVTKCPDFKTINKEQIISRSAPTSLQSVFFSRIKYGSVFPFSGNADFGVLRNCKVILVTGIANAASLKQFVMSNNELVHHFCFTDHHNYSLKDLREIHNLFDKFASQQTILLTTEKDAMRLYNDTFKTEIIQYPWCFQSIEVEFDEAEKFDNLIKDYVEKNS